MRVKYSLEVCMAWWGSIMSCLLDKEMVLKNFTASIMLLGEWHWEWLLVNLCDTLISLPSTNTTTRIIQDPTSWPSTPFLESNATPIQISSSSSLSSTSSSSSPSIRDSFVFSPDRLPHLRP